MARPRLLLLLPTTTYRADAFVDAAARLDVDLTVASEIASAFAEDNPDGLLTLPLDDPDRAARLVATFAKRHPLHAVVGVDDDTAIAAAVIGRALGLRHNPIAAMQAARDKHVQRELMTARGVPVPRSTAHTLADDPSRVAREAPYPCVLKPVALSASQGVMRANDRDEFLRARERLSAIVMARSKKRAGPDFLVEEFVSGPEYAIEGLLQDGVLHTLAIFDKPDPLEGPFFEETIYVTPSRASPAVQHEIRHCVQAGASALGLLHGPVHVEVRQGADGSRLIELAARPIGGKCGRVLRFAPDGASLEEVVLRDALGTLEEVPSLIPGASAVMMIPTPRRGVLREVDGVPAARTVPAVEDVMITVHRGDELVPLPEGNRYLGFIFARAADPETAEHALRQAHEALTVRFEE